MTAPPATPLPDPAPARPVPPEDPAPGAAHQQLWQSVQQGAAVNGSGNNVSIVHHHYQLACPCAQSHSCGRTASLAAHGFALGLQEFVLGLRAQWRRLVGPIGPGTTPSDAPGGTDPWQ